MFLTPYPHPLPSPFKKNSFYKVRRKLVGECNKNTNWTSFKQAYRLYVYVFVGDYFSTSILIDWLYSVSHRINQSRVMLRMNHQQRHMIWLLFKNWIILKCFNCSYMINMSNYAVMFVNILVAIWWNFIFHRIFAPCNDFTWHVLTIGI